jgi:hypothetical protein
LYFHSSKQALHTIALLSTEQAMPSSSTTTTMSIGNLRRSLGSSKSSGVRSDDQDSQSVTSLSSKTSQFSLGSLGGSVSSTASTFKKKTKSLSKLMKKTVRKTVGNNGKSSSKSSSSSSSKQDDIMEISSHNHNHSGVSCYNNLPSCADVVVKPQRMQQKKNTNESRAAGRDRDGDDDTSTPSLAMTACMSFDDDASIDFFALDSPSPVRAGRMISNLAQVSEQQETAEVAADAKDMDAIVDLSADEFETFPPWVPTLQVQLQEQAELSESSSSPTSSVSGEDDGDFFIRDAEDFLDVIAEEQEEDPTDVNVDVNVNITELEVELQLQVLAEKVAEDAIAEEPSSCDIAELETEPEPRDMNEIMHILNGNEFKDACKTNNLDGGLPLVMIFAPTAMVLIMAASHFWS